MSFVPFEQFLASLLCEFIDANALAETKYHYICSDPDQAQKLFHAFGAHNGGYKITNVDEVPVRYVETNKNFKLLVMLHQNSGEDRRDTYNEDFIANVRDALNTMPGTAMLVIHNSSLDTILTSCQNLAADNHVFTPEYVYEKLAGDIKKHTNSELIEVISDKNLNEIKEQNLSVFGCISLYQCIKSEQLDFETQSLFEDKRLFDVNEKKAIQKDVNHNSSLYKTIRQLVRDYSDSNQELVQELEVIGLGDKFINDYFLKAQRDDWKNIEYRVLCEEINKNKISKLDVDSIEVDDSKLKTYKREGSSGAKYKRFTVLIEEQVGSVDLKIRMRKSGSHLKQDHIKVVGNYDPKLDSLRVSNHEHQSVISLSLNFTGEVKSFQIRLNRPTSSENYQFNVLLIEEDTLRLGEVFEKLLIAYKRNKPTFFLENVTEKLVLNSDKPTFRVESNNSEIDLEKYGALDVEKVFDHEDSTILTLTHSYSKIELVVLGRQTLESINLPGILDPNRAHNIHMLEGLAEYNEKTNRVIYGGKERELSVKAQKLCKVEFSFISQRLVFIDDVNKQEISVDDLSVHFKDLAHCYARLFDWLMDNQTLISVTSWPTKLREIIEELLDAYHVALNKIPKGHSLSDSNRLLLKIGNYYGSLEREDEATDWFTPIHPINLAYISLLTGKLLSTNSSLEKIPEPTLAKLNPSGMIPIIYESDSEYGFTVANSNNRFWLQVMPRRKNDHEFVERLVFEKINDFISCFRVLFAHNRNAPVKLNSIHNQNNKHVFNGVIKYFRKHGLGSRSIHVNLYDDNVYETFFDIFAESNDPDLIREIIRSKVNEKPEETDQLISLVRLKLSFSKNHITSDFDYSHISFYKNNEKVELKDKKVEIAKSGIACEGLISGEASYLENHNYYTGFGLKNIINDNHLLKIARIFNSLLKPLKDQSSSYMEGAVPVLAVKDSFKSQLKSSYKKSIWTCVVDPKVTLDFFDDKDTVLVHYSDQYTNSTAYDAITVSARSDLFEGLLPDTKDGQISSFNAINGQWLLDIFKGAGSKNKKDSSDKQLKEKQGIVAAYKLWASMLLHNDITWVPLSIAELIRVTGSVGLKIKETDFSVRLINKKEGVMSDDLLFVGFIDKAMVLLPLEVKTREKGNDFTKAIKQAHELGEHMRSLLSSKNFSGQVYRSLFIQHVMSQVERYKLYDVFPKEYFDELEENREYYQQGDYEVCEIDNYYSAAVVAFSENKSTAHLHSVIDEKHNILALEVTSGLLDALHNQSIENLSRKIAGGSYSELDSFILRSTSLTSLKAESLKLENSNIDGGEETEFANSSPDANAEGSDFSEVVIDQPRDANEEAEFATEKPEFISSNSGQDADYSIQPRTSNDHQDWDNQFRERYGSLIDEIEINLGNEVQTKELLKLSEDEFVDLVGNDQAKLLNFYKLKHDLQSALLSNQTSRSQVESHDVNSKAFRDVNISSDLFALKNLLLREYGESLTVGQLLQTSENEFKKIRGVGKGKVASFQVLKERLRELTDDDNDEPSTHNSKRLISNIDELDEELNNALNTYLREAKDREKTIFEKRFSIGNPPHTLEELGEEFGVTRERVRQLEVRAKRNFLSHLKASSKEIRSIIEDNVWVLNDGLKKLKARFLSDKEFYSLLELAADIDDLSLNDYLNSEWIPKDIFNDYWVTHTSPASLDDISWYLHEALDADIEVIRSQLVDWESKSLIRIDSQKVSPLKLPKAEALANALLDFPNGSSWLEAQRRAIEKQSSSVEITLDRMDNSLVTACDREYIYQSGRGQYRHLSYLEISQSDIDYVLASVKSKLQEYSYKGRSSVNLAVDVVEKSNFTIDYFVTRHIIRAYGETVGIFFNGRSGSDTVSLDTEFSLASQKTVLADVFKNSLTPLNKKDVAEKIRSKSNHHAALYIDQLLSDGIIVRIDDTHYEHIENAFHSVDIDQMMNELLSFLGQQQQVVEAGVIQAHMNSKLSVGHNKQFYLSILKHFSPRYGEKLYFVQNLVSFHKIEKSGLVDYCRDALSKTDDPKEALRLLEETLSADNDVLKRCLHDASLDNNVQISSDKLNNDVVTQDTQKKEIVDIPNSYSPVHEQNIDENTRILIGNTIDTGEGVFWEYGNRSLANRHLIIFGRSGQGKTYCIQSLLLELARVACNPLIIDYTNGFLPNHLEHEFISELKPDSHFLAQKPLGISPFRKQSQDYGGVRLEEQDHIIAARITSVFNQVYSSIGEQQIATLMNTIEDGVKRHSVKYDFESMLDDLREEGRVGEVLANKLAPMVKSRLFDNSNTIGWNDIFHGHEARINIIQLASLSRDIMRLATEFTLWDIYSYVSSYGNKDKPLPLVLDEVQNLDHRLESPLGKMLTEGRKYGISLILATQSLSALNREEQDRLFQASHKLFFAPAETEIQSFAKLLEQAVPGSNRKDWLEELAALKKGECISVGLHQNYMGRLEQSAKVVKIPSMSSRLSHRDKSTITE